MSVGKGIILIWTILSLTADRKLQRARILKELSIMELKGYIDMGFVYPYKYPTYSPEADRIIKLMETELMEWPNDLSEPTEEGERIRELFGEIIEYWNPVLYGEITSFVRDLQNNDKQGGRSLEVLDEEVRSLFLGMVRDSTVAYIHPSLLQLTPESMELGCRYPNGISRHLDDLMAGASARYQENVDSARVADLLRSLIEKKLEEPRFHDYYELAHNGEGFHLREGNTVFLWGPIRREGDEWCIGFPRSRTYFGLRLDGPVLGSVDNQQYGFVLGLNRGGFYVHVAMMCLYRPFKAEFGSIDDALSKLVSDIYLDQETISDIAAFLGPYQPTLDSLIELTRRFRTEFGRPLHAKMPWRAPAHQIFLQRRADCFLRCKALLAILQATDLMEKYSIHVEFVDLNFNGQPDHVRLSVHDGKSLIVLDPTLNQYLGIVTHDVRIYPSEGNVVWDEVRPVFRPTSSRIETAATGGGISSFVLQELWKSLGECSERLAALEEMFDGS